MESLIDSLDSAKWKEIPASEKPDDFIEFHVNRSRKQVDATTIGYMVENDTVDPRPVELNFCKKDPIKGVNIIEFRLSADNKVTGIDQNGDVVVLQ